MHQRTHKSNSSNPSRQEKSAPFFRHTAIVQAKQNSSTPPTQEEIENNAFAQNKFEAVGLQIKQTKGTITPIEQERLGVLQAKMDDVLAKRVERAERFGHHLANISLHSPDRPVSAPVPHKLAIATHHNSDKLQHMHNSPRTVGNKEPNWLQRNITDLSPHQCYRSSSIVQTNQLSQSIQEKGFTKNQDARNVNQTGLPDNLKSGIENLSGISMDDVRVHFNSSKPAEINALAYTQGTEIHLAPDQTKHLPHEAWHVVQQKQGRVKKTQQLNGVWINDDKEMEREADLMGTQAKTSTPSLKKITDTEKPLQLVIQRVKKENLLGKINIMNANINRKIYENFDQMPADIEKRADNIVEIINKFEEKIQGYFPRVSLLEIFTNGLESNTKDEDLIIMAVDYCRKENFEVPDDYKKYLNRFSEEEVIKFKNLQSNPRKEKGQQEASALLSDTGKKMPQEFKNISWVGSGPEPKTNLPAVDKEEKGKNNFAEWIHALVAKDPNADKLAPNQSSSYQMNCWEGVMYTAYKAGLVNEQWLLDVHVKASESGSKYFDSLAKSLGFDNAIPYDPMNKLIPEEGDIVFFYKMEHVALSLGGEDLLHLWHSTEGGKPTFEKTTFSALFLSRKDLITNTMFAPAPFKKL